jgi:hypothetical protein
VIDMNLLTSKTKAKVGQLTNQTFTAATIAAAVHENQARDEAAINFVAYPALDEIEPDVVTAAVTTPTSKGALVRAHRSKEQTAAMKATLRAAIDNGTDKDGPERDRLLMTAFNACCDIHTNNYMKRDNVASMRANLRYFFPDEFEGASREKRVSGTARPTGGQADRPQGVAGVDYV